MAKLIPSKKVCSIIEKDRTKHCKIHQQIVHCIYFYSQKELKKVLCRKGYNLVNPGETKEQQQQKSFFFTT